MKDLAANPLDYTESKYANRRRELSEILDSTNPDLSAFQKRGGKMIVAIGTNDTTAPPGAQLDYYQSVLEKMGRSKVDEFARLYVLPQTGHGLSGSNYAIDGDGKQIESKPIPNSWDRFALLVDWVENGKAPGKSIKVTAGDKSLPMCSYPEYPKYNKGPENAGGVLQLQFEVGCRSLLGRGHRSSVEQSSRQNQGDRRTEIGSSIPCSQDVTVRPMRLSEN